MLANIDSFFSAQGILHNFVNNHAFYLIEIIIKKNVRLFFIAYVGT